METGDNARGTRQYRVVSYEQATRPGPRSVTAPVHKQGALSTLPNSLDNAPGIARKDIR